MHIRTLVWASTLALVFVPSAGLAAFSSPSSLFEALRMQEINMQPTAVRLEAHGAVDGTYVSLWVKGKTAAETPLTAKGAFQGTLDVMHEGKTVRMRGEMIVDMPNVYFRLQSVRGATELDIPMEDIRPYMSKWIHADLTPLLDDADLQMFNLQTSTDAQWETLSILLAQEGIELSAEQIKNAYLQIVDSVFAMTSESIGESTIYSLTLKPDFLDQTVRTIQNLGTSLSLLDGPSAFMNESDLAEMRKAQTILNESVKFSMTVTLGADDAWQAHAASFDFSPNEALRAEMEADVEYARLRMGGTRIESFSVTAPKVWKTLEDLLGNSFPAGVHVEDESDWEDDYNWEPEGMDDSILPITGPRSRRLTQEAARVRRAQELRSRQQ